MVRTRHFITGAMPSNASTRLEYCTPPKVTAEGSASVPPTLPAWSIFDSHSAGDPPSPGVGKDWVSVQESTSACAEPRQTCVVMVVNRFRVKNVGASLPVQAVPASQIWSNGTSGHAALLDDVRLVQVSVPDGMHRSATPNTTRAGAEVVRRVLDRWPYSIRLSQLPRLLTRPAPTSPLFSLHLASP